MLGKIYAFFLYIILSVHIITCRKKKVYNNKILVIQCGSIGDGLLNAPALEALQSYCEKMGKELYCFCANPVKTIYKMIPELKKIKYIDEEYGIDISFKTMTKPTLSDVNKIRHSIFHGSFERVIGLMCRNRKMSFLFLGMRGRENYYLDPLKAKNTFVYKLTYRFMSLFSEIMTDGEDVPRVEHVRDFLKSIGIDNYKTRVPYIPTQRGNARSVISECTNYITISIDSSCTQRRWPEESFISLIDLLLKNYDYTIVLTGSYVSKGMMEKYLRAFDKNDRVINCVGVLAIEDWVELLRNSSFHIGTDSGPIHVAASVGTMAFCLTGVWDGGRFFPYDVEEHQVGTVEPICLYRQDVDIKKISCYDCNAKKVYGFGNSECTKKCRLALPCVCLEKITVDDVMDAIRDAKSRSLI